MVKNMFIYEKIELFDELSIIYHKQCYHIQGHLSIWFEICLTLTARDRL